MRSNEHIEVVGTDEACSDSQGRVFVRFGYL